MHRSGKKKAEDGRMEQLKFLLVKTAAVRQGVKPGELLRVRHCYESAGGGSRVMLYRNDIYGIVGLDYAELKITPAASLVLFYKPGLLAETLAQARNAKWLERLGYPPAGAALEAKIAHLAARAADCNIPHEVGLFIGYPLKDVAGFMLNIPSTPVSRAQWRVYGNREESLEKMRLYSRIEAEAARAFAGADGIDGFINAVSAKKAG